MGIRRIKRALILTIISGEPTSGFRHVFGSENVREYCLGDKRARGVAKPIIQADIAREAKAFKPDWIWMQVQNYDYANPELIAGLRKASPGCFISTWTGDMRTTVLPNQKALFPIVDMTTVSSLGQIPMFEDAGARNVRYCQNAYDEDLFPDNAWTPPFRVPDVVLCGNYWKDGGFPDYDDRRQAVLALVEAGVDVGVVGRGWPSDVPCIGECPRLHQRAIYRRAKVALNVNNFNGVELYYSRRLLIAMASGIPVVATYVPGLEKEFDQEENLLWYESLDELVTHVQSFLHRRQAREFYARKAGELVRAEHLWRNRVVALLPESEAIMNEKGAACKS